jgi:hypothetical protein
MSEKVNVSLEPSREDLLDDLEEETPIKSGKTAKVDESGRKAKGRGIGQSNEKEVEERYSGKGGEFEVMGGEDKPGPIRCKKS